MNIIVDSICKGFMYKLRVPQKVLIHRNLNPNQNLLSNLFIFLHF